MASQFRYVKEKLIGQTIRMNSRDYPGSVRDARRARGYTTIIVDAGCMTEEAFAGRYNIICGDGQHFSVDQFDDYEII